MQAERGLAREQTVAEATGQTSRFLNVWRNTRRRLMSRAGACIWRPWNVCMSGTDKIIIDGKVGQGLVPFLPLDYYKGARTAATDPCVTDL